MARSERTVAEVEVGGEKSERKSSDPKRHLKSAGPVSYAPKSGLGTTGRLRFWKLNLYVW
jgi:hypothetical protein